MATPMATRRLKQDYLRLMRDPVPYVEASPLPSNILEWHYVVKGPEDTPYYGGYYHGKLVFPKEYPFKPPRIMMMTPNGRFKTNIRLCLSISDFHPDTWNPAWSVATILTGLLSFMVETTATLGSIESSLETKKSLAVASWTFNVKNVTFCHLFPQICEEIQMRQAEHLVNRAGMEKAKDSAEFDTAHARTQHNPYTHCNGFCANMSLVVVVVLFGFLVHTVVQNAS